MDTHGTPNTTPAPLDGFYASPAHMRMQARRVLALIAHAQDSGGFDAIRHTGRALEISSELAAISALRGGGIAAYMEKASSALIEALGSGPRDRGMCLGVAANYAQFAAEYLEA